MDEYLSENRSHKWWTLPKSRDNGPLLESQAVTTETKICLLPSPTILLVFSPSLSGRLRLSPLRVRRAACIAPLFDRTHAHFTEVLRNPSRQMMKAEPEHTSELLYQSLSKISLKLLRASQSMNIYSKTLSWPRPANVQCLLESGVSFLSRPYHLVAV